MLFSMSKDIIREHYAKFLGVNSDDFMIFAADPEAEDQVDIIWIKPTKNFNYNVLATCGLSEIEMENPDQCMELMMLLPPDWKVDDSKEEWRWPVELLSQVAYLPFETENYNYTLGTVVSLTEDDKPFMKGTKNCGAIITFPEHFPPEMFQLEVEEDYYVRFFQCVPINKDDIERMTETSPLKFIEFNLHNADGPDFVVKKR